MITKTEIAAFRQQLVDLQRRLSEDFRQLKEEALEPTGGEASGGLSNVPVHPADLGSHLAEGELTLTIMENEERIANDVEAALARIDEGTFGRCEACRQEIPKQRLLAMPHARHCVPCAQRLGPGV